MRYVLMVCSDETEQMTLEAAVERHADFMACEEEMQSRGALVTRERLHPTSSSTTVRVRHDDLVIEDGPFVETKEQIAGFFVVEAQDLDAAIELASLIPAAHYGMIEVRPVWEG